MTLLAAAAAAATLTGGATASAATLSPNKSDFGEQQVGTVSAPQIFMLSAQCQKVDEFFFCEAPEALKP